MICTSSPLLSSICVQSWNCRGLISWVPYVQIMAEGADIIILCEHWLWSYQLHELELRHSEFKAFGVADKRLRHLILIQVVEGLRYRGINLYLPHPRICTIQLKHCASSSVMTNIEAYLPSTDHQIERI